MNRKDVINVLKMENDLITFDPMTGEDIDVECLNELNKKCYIAHEEAIEFLQQSIPIEWIEKKVQEFLMNRNFRWATDFQEVVDMWKVENNIPLFDDEFKKTLEKENDSK